MRAGLLVIVGLVAGIASGPVVAQEASARETRCWVGDVGFSQGLRVNTGDGVAVCEAGTWQEVKAEASAVGCLLEGDMSSVGAVVGVRNSDGVLLQCMPDGRWETIGVRSAKG